MSPDDLPPDVLELLRERISGLIELDVLLCMRGDATRSWTAPTLANLVGLPEEWAEEALVALRGAELIEEAEGGTERRFFYRPTTPDLEAAVTTLAHAYEDRPDYVARILTEDAISRVRWSASQAFPAAFVVGGIKTDALDHSAAAKGEA